MIKNELKGSANHLVVGEIDEDQTVYCEDEASRAAERTERVRLAFIAPAEGAAAEPRGSRMGFMDKVKTTAQQAADQAKAATSQAQTKIEQTQLRKKMDDYAKQLGYLIYSERAKGMPAGDQAAELVARIASLERQIEAEQAGAAPTTQAPDAGPAAGSGEAGGRPGEVPTSGSEPTSDDFKL